MIIHNQGIYEEITALTPARFGILMGYVPWLSLACFPNWLFLEWINVYTWSWGGKIKVMYIIDVYIYIYSLYHSYHTPLMMMYAGVYGIQFYVHNRIMCIFTWSSLSLHPPKDEGVWSSEKSIIWHVHNSMTYMSTIKSLLLTPAP